VEVLMRRYRRTFTLIEVVISLSLFAFLMSMIFGYVYFFMEAKKASSHQSQHLLELEYSYKRLQRLFSSAVISSPSEIEGAGTTAKAMRRGSLRKPFIFYSPEEHRLCWRTMYPQPQHSLDLIVDLSWNSETGELTVAGWPSSAFTTSNARVEPIFREVLVRGVKHISFVFYSQEIQIYTPPHLITDDAQLPSLVEIEILVSGQRGDVNEGEKRLFTFSFGRG
jgi:type II secretory pathway pseudopilin PulG